MRQHAFFDIQYPRDEALTPKLKDYIERDLSRFEKALYSLITIRRVMDIKTLSMWMNSSIILFSWKSSFSMTREIFRLFSIKTSTGNLSLSCGFNNSLGNVSDSSDDDFRIRQFVSVQAPWFTMLIKDEGFINQVIRRYRQLRLGMLSDARVKSYIQEVVAYLGPAADLQFRSLGLQLRSGKS